MKGARDCWETLPWETVKAPAAGSQNSPEEHPEQ